MASYRWVSDENLDEMGEERKLIQRPRCVVELRVEARWFKEERGVAVTKVLVRNKTDELVLVLLIASGEMDLEVKVRPDVREDHIVLVGEMGRDA